MHCRFFRSVVAAGALCVPAALVADSVMEGGEAATDGAFVVRSFTNTAESSTLTVYEDAFVDILVVGGGGGGGRGGNGAPAGGGGAGAVIWKKGVRLSAGTYEIAIGAGGNGATGTSVPGGTGGVTTVVRVDGEERTAVYEAPGGGGGGDWKWALPTEGACGGGGGNGNWAAGTRGLGCSGAGGSGQTYGGGGGGVSSAGQQANGGAGIYCDITGVNEPYGWGGGGSRQTESADGGAGDPDGYGQGGCGFQTTSPGGVTGRANHGGGGGGGQKAGGGAAGGSGVVIVRYGAVSAAAGEPMLLTTDQTDVFLTMATVGGRIVRMGGAASLSVKVLYGEVGGEMSGEVDVGVFTAPGAFAKTLTGLESGAVYEYVLEASDGSSTYRSDVRLLTLSKQLEAMSAENATVTTNGIYEIFTFMANGSFSVTGTGPADILLVGGGGGGGSGGSTTSGGGGGGGGGGVIYREGFELENGKTYAVTIGAGGTAGYNYANGGAGGNTVLTVDATDLFTALGGGGGGGGSSAGNDGTAGGSAGGSGSKKTTKVRPKPEMQGGASIGGDAYGGAGGGGAGGDSVPETGVAAGAGGIGFFCAITGADAYYGGGGGGGGCYCEDIVGGAGGLGGGGDGCTKCNGNHGTNGLGGGGGGGYGQYSTYHTAGKGGSGVVIVRRRYQPLEDPTPHFALDEATPGGGSVRLAFTVQDLGCGFTACDLKLAIAKKGEVLPEMSVVAQEIGVGAQTFTAEGLDPLTEYVGRVTIANAEAAAEPVDFSFTTRQGGSAEPIVELVGMTPNDDMSVTVGYDLVWPGTGASVADVVLRWRVKGEAAAETATIASGVLGEGEANKAGFLPGTTYCLAIRATNAHGEASAFSDEVEVKIPGSAPIANSWVASVQDGVATVGWTVKYLGDLAKSAALTVQYSTASDFATCLSVDAGLAERAPLTGSTEIPGIAADTTYYVRTVVASDIGMEFVTPVSTFVRRAAVMVNPDGTRIYQPATPESMAAELATAILFPGDAVRLPGTVNATSRYTSDSTVALTVADGSVTAVEAGAMLVKPYSIATAGDGTAVTNAGETVALIVAPSAADCPAGVWLNRTTANLTWTDPAAWERVSGPEGDGYPDGAGVCALLYAKGGRTVTLPAEGVTLGYLGVGAVGSGTTTLTGGTITYETQGTAWMRTATKADRSISPIVFAASVTNRFLVDTEIDFLGSVGPKITWNGIFIDRGVTLRTCRGIMAADEYQYGMEFDGDLIGEGTLRLDADMYNFFASLTMNDAAKRNASELRMRRSFKGTIDLANGRRGGGHWGRGMLYQLASLPDAEALIVRGTFAANGAGATFASGDEKVMGPVNGVDVYPKKIVLDGGSMYLGSLGGNGGTPPRHESTVGEMALTGPMGKLVIADLNEGAVVSGVAATTTVTKLTVGLGVTETFGRTAPAVLRVATSPAEAVAADDGRELLPFLRAAAGKRAYRETAGGDVVLGDATSLSALPMEDGDDVHVTGNGNFEVTVDASELTFRSLSFSAGWGGFTYAFANPGARIAVTGGYLDLDASDKGTGVGVLGKVSDTNSVLATLDFGARPGRVFATSAGNAIGMRIAGTGGLVKGGKGNVTLTADSSATLSGGVYVNCGRLTFGADGHDASIGANALTVFAGATAAFVTRQPVSAKETVIALVDQPQIGQYGRIDLASGETKCRKLVVDGKAVRRGTWGATGSGAEFIDDNHFTGSGVLRVRRDDNPPGFAITVR